MPVYRKAAGTKEEIIAGRHVLVNQGGGKIVIDRFIQSLLEKADGRELTEILDEMRGDDYTDLQVRFCLACLAEAGFLIREEENPAADSPQAVQGSLISTVIVSHNSLDWLKLSLPSLEKQTYTPLEILIVDNASRDGTQVWLQENYPQIKLVALDAPVSFARAINLGIEVSAGEYFLLLNPDVVLEPDVVAQMYLKAVELAECGAVAAKLRFLRLPHFLNGVGNSIGGLGWGTDNGLGYLDLGQFDDWLELPSACFAATLIPRSAWEIVGSVDEEFPMYYEDIEWSYRARLYGKSVYLASQAVVYHAFSGHQPSLSSEQRLTPKKLSQVVYGRLRFILRILSPISLIRFLVGYLLEDLLRFLIAMFSGQGEILQAYFYGWAEFLKRLPTLLGERRRIQRGRVVKDSQLLRLQKKVPMPVIWQGLPELTLDVILIFYWPWLVSGKIRPLSELDRLFESDDQQDFSRGIKNHYKRFKTIVRMEGWNGLVHRTLRQIHWRLRQA